MLSGSVKDSVGYVENASIKITGNKTKTILAFTNIGKSKSFSFAIKKDSQNDSILIAVSHINYLTFVQSIAFPQNNDSIYFPVVLQPLYNSLDSVVVQATPVYTRGDTTFFRAEAFKTGDERKLKDLITKMPGFEIDKDGNLLYNKNRVEKIMIEGEEVFAEKVKLLLASLPVHIIGNVQALERQSNEKLLKGISDGGRTFVNIGLTEKAKLKASFGDGEAGLGTAGYLLKPTLFSLYDKLKFGYIGNLNSIGDGIDWQIEYEISKNYLRGNEHWGMNLSQMQLINNVESRRFINNNQFKNNLQINIPVSKKIKSKTDIDFLTDVQKQNVASFSRLLNDNNFFERNEQRRIQYKPVIFTGRQTLEYNIDTTQKLLTEIDVIINNAISTFNANITDSNTVLNTSNAIKNSYLHIGLINTYTKRYSAKKATQTTLQLGKSNLPQNANAYSPSWATAFSLPATYMYLHQQSDINASTASISHKLMSKKKRLNTYEMNANVKRINTAPTTAFSNTLDKINPAILNTNNTYTKYEASGNTRFYFSKKLESKLNIGYANIQSKEDLKRSFNYLLIKSEVSYSTLFTKYSSLLYTVGYQQKAPELSNFNRSLLPQFLGSFDYSLITNKPIKVFSTSIYSKHNWKRKLFIANYSLSYSRNFNSFVYNQSYRQLALFSFDSLINKGTNDFILNTTTTFNSLKQKSLYTFTLGINKSQSYILLNNELDKTNNTLYYTILTAKPTLFNKRLYLNSEIHLFYSTNKGKIFKSYGNQYKFKIFPRWAITKYMNLIISGEYIFSKLDKYTQSLPLFDAEYNITFPKKSYYFILRAQNIINKKNYYLYDNYSALSRTFSYIPIVERNVMLSFYYNL